jgi:sugar O-acyltransferase (sialic acid O-acetyltransferase NeuD family)
MRGIPNLVLVGAGGHARSCIDVIENEGNFRIVGLVGLKEEVGSKLCGYDVIGTDTDISALAKEYSHALLAVGQSKNPQQRIDLFTMIIQSGFLAPVVISPQAYVSQHAQISFGSIVLHGAVISSGVTIGKNCIVNSQSLIEHDSQIHDHCHISTGALVNGGVTVKEATFIGSGSIIRNGVSIGERCFVGMGSQVTKNLQANSRFVADKS